MSLPGLKRRLQPDAHEFTARLLKDPEVKTALDIGCGKSSCLSPFRPRIRTVGLDAFAGAIETSRSLNLHDDYILADIRQTSTEGLLEKVQGQKFDIVALYDVLEHLPKKVGWELLDKCEELTNRYILIQTPCGFVQQGPEDNNPYQRHLSGWFPHELEGLGYTVAGCAGTRFFHGYAGMFKWNFPGVKLADFVLGWVLNLEKHPNRAFNIMAWKNIRGVPPQL